jgi:hypothetical protein
MDGYLVAQTDDRVRVKQPGRYHGLVGVVVREYPCVEVPSGTARVCDVCVDGVGEVRVHADYLSVLGAGGTTHDE